MKKIQKSQIIKQENGITLIALVITIIVLLILAGVTIAMLMGNNGILRQAGDAKVMTNLSKVDEAIKLYKSSLKVNKVVDEGSTEEVTIDDLIKNVVLKEYVIEETLRPIAVVEGYDKLNISDKFGEGYKNIEEKTIEGESTPYIGTVNELNNVCAIDLTDGTLYYLESGKVWSIEGKKEIANNYERVNAQEGEWTFDSTTKTLTGYLGDLTVARGEQEVGEVKVPNYYNGERVSALGNSVFASNTNLTKLTISKGIQSIRDNCFYGCSNLVGDLIIPDSIKTIGKYSFRECTGLTGSLDLGEVETIGQGAFQQCSKLTGDLIIPDSVKNLKNEVFFRCSGFKGRLKIGKGIDRIESLTFSGCSGLTGNLEIPEGISSIGNSAFGGCSKLTGDLIIPNSVTSIGSNAFNGCSSLDGQLKIGANVETIGEAAFQACSKLKGEVIIPDSVTTMGRYAFFHDSSLEKIYIGKGLTKIGQWNFLGCTRCKEVYIPQNITIIDDSAFSNLAAESIIYVQNSSQVELLEGKYTADNTTVIVDPSKFE
ncbi:MAG: leucine-rich repeat protein [Clostridia bacterium]|nr:leucine-rich repeat protein [Clostridia bacterium]